MIGYAIAFILGAMSMWYFGYKLLHRVYGKGKMLNHVLGNLGPDGFKRLHDAVVAERVRRDELLRSEPS